MKSINITIALITLLVLSSCNFNLQLGQVDGNGHVTTEERPLNGPFHEVKGSAGLDVYLSEGAEEKVVVEADENLMEIIETEIHNGRLTITTTESIGRSKAKKVHVTYVSLDKILASSGSDVIANSVVKSEVLSLDASSGADLEVEIFAKEAYVETSSGADIKVSGKASSLFADASSGSDLNAKNLMVLNCNADASSGADITVNVKESLKADASSGGDVNYYGNPSAVTNNGSKSGSVRKM
ncbi:putative autotransporter adhesin-like protein [Ulvibacter sp. MAR_2010_11]|uniref:head GIN domain-containing protein n=1 Tax=Ulvibacter sp. MAR_2010_11 TaxID=1250229 RepID=UPI000C2CA6E6|nr:head GIN domain-containing protein [Ulvibacter sp. MAR_2010_11]PKA83835.1 putative autotransporter adhesin-like protein [Ulvibacter sp. MAR_2010_11]